MTQEKAKREDDEEEDEDEGEEESFFHVSTIHTIGFSTAAVSWVLSR